MVATGYFDRNTVACYPTPQTTVQLIKVADGEFTRPSLKPGGLGVGTARCHRRGRRVILTRLHPVDLKS